ncbi:UDP-4-amino-4,6-dideoxy-N-acetyl-beta-L-altrosamine transaminase [Pseudooceanicola sp.]|uniref:UDP-4-amino-4, 6-dideoxy-N-acetyl-beta-L-altrosamine transaminase n=1 Tax=Pseudooceanicola sp. TaxID=1914328 RepID=UPI0035C7040B
MIPYGRQDIRQEDIDAVVEVLASDFLTQGPVIGRFEEAVAAKCGASHGIAVTNATAALHIACLALDLGPGDTLWTTPITFVASSNCALYCGAKVDFVDIDPKTYNLCPVELEKKLIAAKASGRLPKVVVAVHLTGQSCDMAAIHRLSEEYGFRIIEDASHAIGGRYQGAPVGDCRYSDIAIFSFHPVKIVTTAEGGMALTNDHRLAERLRLLRSHGITRDPAAMEGESHGPWYYQQIDLGFNYRMTELQAALGLSQLARLDEYVSRRHELAARYNSALSKLPVALPYQHPDSYSAYHLYVVRVNEAADHRRIFEDLRNAGIGINLHYIPVHMQPYYQRMGFSEGDFPKAEAYYSTAISLPLFPTLTEDHQDTVVNELGRALG